MPRCKPHPCVPPEAPLDPGPLAGTRDQRLTVTDTREGVLLPKGISVTVDAKIAPNATPVKWEHVVVDVSPPGRVAKAEGFSMQLVHIVL